MDWFLYDNGPRHERVNILKYEVSYSAAVLHNEKSSDILEITSQ